MRLDRSCRRVKERKDAGRKRRREKGGRCELKSKDPKNA
jgi:hypothetical protein